MYPGLETYCSGFRVRRSKFKVIAGGGIIVDAACLIPSSFFVQLFSVMDSLCLYHRCAVCLCFCVWLCFSRLVSVMSVCLSVSVSLLGYQLPVWLW